MINGKYISFFNLPFSWFKWVTLVWLNNFCLYCSCRKSLCPKPWMKRQVERVLYIAGFPLESTKEKVQCFFFFFCYKYCNYISFFNYFLFELRSLYAIYHPKKKNKTVCIKNLGWFTLFITGCVFLPVCAAIGLWFIVKICFIFWIIVKIYFIFIWSACNKGGKVEFHFGLEAYSVWKLKLWWQWRW